MLTGVFGVKKPWSSPRRPLHARPALLQALRTPRRPGDLHPTARGQPPESTTVRGHGLRGPSLAGLWTVSPGDTALRAQQRARLSRQVMNEMSLLSLPSIGVVVTLHLA
jgi:hypothetical protein